MPKKYLIHVEVTPPRFQPVGKYATVQFQEECAGSCRDCVKSRCIYGIHEKNREHASAMTEPEYLYSCESCLRCVQECIRGTLSLTANPDYRLMGDDYWTPEIITTTWNQAEKGAVPVSGAGYRGPFVGKGFDAMWTDMSEIVRPTRDGIHGREYINTLVQLSRRPLRLEFKNGALLDEAPAVLEIPLPGLFQPQGFAPLGRGVLRAAALAAGKLGTLMLVRPEDYGEDLEPYAASLVPCLTGDNYKEYTGLIKKSLMIELAYRPGIAAELGELRAVKPELAVAVGINLGEKAADIALELAADDVDTLHFYADSHGNEPEAAEPRFLQETIREIHMKLVEAGLRERVNLVFSGGIALAEHMAKAIICGADAVVIDWPLLVALECRLCRRCEAGKPCPVKMEEVEPGWGSQRLLNLMGAWRNQLIEVMGAMGIRETRRLRGEVGRAMFFEDLERETFGALFGGRKAEGVS
jgi:ferredoxin